MRRIILLPLLLLLVTVSCGDDDDAATTTVAETTTTTAVAEESSTTTVPEDPRQQGPPFITQGERGSLVRALQIYLDCGGYGPITIDGVFGEETGDAVRRAQVAEGGEATGQPDEESFAWLSRACDRDRDVVFDTGTSSMDVAGNVAPGDDELFYLRVLEGQEMTITIIGGVEVAVMGDDGGALHEPDGSVVVVVDIPTSQMYEIRVSADEPTSYSLTIDIPMLPADDVGDFYLTDDGFNEIEFGADPEETIIALTDLFGDPADDGGWIEGDDSRCASQTREVSWLFPEAEGNPSSTLSVMFHDFNRDAPVFARWRYYLTFPGPEAEGEEGGFLSTWHGLSVGHSYDHAVSFGFVLGGFEELGHGSLDGINVHIHADSGVFEEGEVFSMDAGAWECPDPF